MVPDPSRPSQHPMSTDTVSSCRDFHRPHVPCGALTAATVSAVTVLDWLPEPLQPVAMRMARADELIFELAQVAFAWSRGPNDEGPLELRQVERRPGVLDVEVTSIRPVPPAASALFSEVVHHMRSALDNTVFFLVEAARGGPLTGHQVRAVSMPICDDEKVFQNNVGKLAKKGIHELDVDTTLGQRVASLQPFADPVAVPAISPLLAAEMGDPNPDQQHPLVLLRDYSNEDKHRAFRIAACRALIQSSRDLKGTRRMGMRPIAVGDVVDVVRKDVPELMDIFSALHVQRPNGVWVSPVAELDHIWQHVAYVVLPTLVTGMALPRELPAQVDLGDSGLTLAERLKAGGGRRAHERHREIVIRETLAAMHQPPRLFPIVSADGGGDPARSG